MTKIKRYLYNELWAGKNWFDKAFMFAMLALQIIVFIIAPESPLSIIAGLAGVVSVVLCAQGKISFHFILLALCKLFHIYLSRGTHIFMVK